MRVINVVGAAVARLRHHHIGRKAAPHIGRGLQAREGRHGLEVVVADAAGAVKEHHQRVALASHRPGGASSRYGMSVLPASNTASESPPAARRDTAPPAPAARPWARSAAAIQAPCRARPPRAAGAGQDHAQRRAAQARARACRRAPPAPAGRGPIQGRDPSGSPRVRRGRDPPAGGRAQPAGSAEIVESPTRRNVKNCADYVCLVGRPPPARRRYW